MILEQGIRRTVPRWFCPRLKIFKICPILVLPELKFACPQPKNPSLGQCPVPGPWFRTYSIWNIHIQVQVTWVEDSIIRRNRPISYGPYHMNLIQNESYYNHWESESGTQILLTSLASSSHWVSEYTLNEFSLWRGRKRCQQYLSSRDYDSYDIIWWIWYGPYEAKNPSKTVFFWSWSCFNIFKL